MTQYDSVIGLEVHAQLSTATKLFCRCSNQSGAEPNTHTCPVCLGLPGALPVLNDQAIHLAIKAGLALNCTINYHSEFSRKNYFYPDLPKGYQISQFDLPICSNGSLTFMVDGQEKTVRIQRIHIEEDAGKLVHQGSDGIAEATGSNVDLNRAGTPLIEIVSEPDIQSAKEAKAYLETLRSIITFAQVCDGNMQEGHLRADANVSIRPTGATTLGTRTEVKNLNSFRSIEKAINVEIARQIAVVESGGTVVQETRHFDDATQQTSSLRSKEDAHDYRYFPEPDLRPLHITQTEIDTIRQAMPERPDHKRNRYITDLALGEFEATVLTTDFDMNQYFESVLNLNLVPAPLIAKWVVGDLNALIKEQKESFITTKVSPSHLSELLSAIHTETISTAMGKTILAKSVTSGESPAILIKQSGGTQISDSSELQSIVDTILEQNPDVVEKIKNGKKESANFLMGQVMKASKGRAKPDLVKELIFKSIPS